MSEENGILEGKELKEVRGYIFLKNNMPVSDAELAEWTIENIQCFYDHWDTFQVASESFGLESAGDWSEYRVIAFDIAAQHYGIDYNVIYTAWLDKKPINFCTDCRTETMAFHKDGSKTCGHCYIERAYDLGVMKRKRTKQGGVK